MPLASPATGAAGRRPLTVTTPRTVGRALVALVALSLATAACSSDADDDTIDASATATDTAADTVADTESDTVGSDSAVQPDPESTTTSTPKVQPEVVTRSPDAVGEGVRPEGFGTALVRITAADGTVCDVCLWHAQDSSQRGRGLMGVTDLGEPVGMAFTWDNPLEGAFVMIGTPTPLSIAWFAADGAHVAETDMEPCLIDDTAACERYRPDGSYTLAIEMFQGELAKVGIGPGSRAEILRFVEPGAEAICPLLD